VIERWKFNHEEKEKRRGEEIGAQCILKRRPAIYKHIAASLEAGPGELDSALTISTIKEESLKFK